MTERSAEEMAAARQLADSLQDEVLGLGSRWKLYRALYGDTPAPLDYWGPSVSAFDLLQSTLFEDIVLRLCRVTERADSPWPTASIFKLAPIVTDIDADAAARLAALLGHLEAATAPLRAERNARLAHASAAPRDLNAPRVRRSHVESAMALLLRAVSIADMAVTGRRVSPYDVLIPMEGDAVILVDLLRRNANSA